MTPQGWQEKTLGEILDKGSSNLSANKLTDCVGIYPVYGAAGLIAKVNFYQQDKEYLAIIKDGAGVGRVYHYQPKTSVLGTLQYLYPKSNTNIRFAYYYLQSIDFAKYYQGAAIPHIYYRDYKSEKLVLPPLPEQERIVAKLDEAFEAIDKVKANAEQNLTNTKELFESYLNNIFSNINASFNKKLSDVTKIVGGGTPSKSTPTYYQGNIPWATVRDMNEDDLSKTEFSITNEAVKSSATNIIPANNVIIATRVGLGKVCILMQDTAINQDLKGIIPTKPMNFKYLFWWFKSIKNKIEEAGVGATVKGVKLPFVQNLQIPYISINDQQKIVEKLDALQEQTKRLEQIYTQKIKECDELKQSILQKAFRGEL